MVEVVPEEARGRTQRATKGRPSRRGRSPRRSSAEKSSGRAEHRPGGGGGHRVWLAETGGVEARWVSSSGNAVISANKGNQSGPFICPIGPSNGSWVYLMGLMGP